MPLLTIIDIDSKKIHGQHELGDGLFTVGRSEDNSIVINNPHVSSRHATIKISGDCVSIVDMNSTNGTSIQDTPLVPNQETPVDYRHPVQIGLHELRFEEVSKKVESPTKQQLNLKVEAIDSFKDAVQEKLFEKLDLAHLEAQNISKDELKAKASNAIKDIVREMASQLPDGISQDKIIKEILAEAVGLGPLEDLLSDKNVTEIMVLRRDQIYIEKSGKIFLSDARFTSDVRLRHAIERIVSSKGKQINELHPYVDTRLDDGSRVNAVIPPIAIDSPVLTIRKFPEKRYTFEDLIRFGSSSQIMIDFLQVCVKHRKNILISGGTGSGKTTLLNILSAFIPSDERIISVEDSAELNLPQEHVLRLEARPPNIEGKGQITIRDLVKNCLRMRPDRIVVGECRGGEAIDMLQAMNTGHDGSLTTLHANTPHDAISRITTMCLMSDIELPSRSIQEQVASAISLIVQTSRLADGQRKIVNISEVMGINESGVLLDTIFDFEERGYTPDGQILGEFVCVNSDPQVYKELKKQKIDVPILTRTSVESPDTARI